MSLVLWYLIILKPPPYLPNKNINIPWCLRLTSPIDLDMSLSSVYISVAWSLVNRLYFERHFVRPTYLPSGSTPSTVSVGIKPPGLYCAVIYFYFHFSFLFERLRQTEKKRRKKKITQNTPYAGLGKYFTSEQYRYSIPCFAIHYRKCTTVPTAASLRGGRLI